MTVASVGPAVQAACEAMRVALAASVSGWRRMRGDGLVPDRRWRDRGGTDGTSVEASERGEAGEEQNRYAMHAFGAQFVEVRVDPDLGEIRVSRFVGAFDAGRVMNAKTARSQLIGGIVYGLGMALFEETHVDGETGRIVNANIAEYLVPVNADVPDIQTIIVAERRTHSNPLGAKGIGELPMVGVAAAVANAVYHATGRARAQRCRYG